MLDLYYRPTYKRDFPAIDYIGILEYVNYVNAELTNTARHVSCSDTDLTMDDMLNLFKDKLYTLYQNIDKDFKHELQTNSKAFFDIEFNH